MAVTRPSRLGARRCLLALATLLLAGCTAPPTAPPQDADVAARLAALRTTDLLLFGEQHDAPAHQQLEQQLVEHLAARGVLAAVALEMAERGTSTATLAADADEAQVRDALRWQAAAWPWPRYAPAVMAAVRAGVPVYGANLPRAESRAVMQDATLDTRLDPAAFAEQQRQIEASHCGLLPAARIVPMTRVQVARDRTMADTLSALQRPGRTVLLIAGGQHVRRDLGVPRHLPPSMPLRVLLAVSGATAATDRTGLDPDDGLWPTPALPPNDACAELRRSWPAPAPR